MANNGFDEVGHGLHAIKGLKSGETKDIPDNRDVDENNGYLGNKCTSDERDAQGRLGGHTGSVSSKAPVPAHAKHYKMNHPKRGLALVFNHEVFEVGGLKSRSGTNEDCQNLKHCLSNLEFDVHIFKDLCYTDLEYQVRQAAAMDHTNHDCICIIILSHGEMNVVYAKDTPYKPEKLWSYFTADKCPSLAGKPKIFLLQACQGDKLDSGVTLHTTETDGDVHSSYKIPAQADFLIVFSTVKGYYSWRNTTKGSWFIQALCDVLNSMAYEDDLLSLLTFVSQRVAVDFESNVPDTITMHRQKQIPCIMSMLTRQIKFPLPRQA